MAGLLLVVLSCLPWSLLASKSIIWSVVPIIVFVETGLAIMTYRALYRLYLVQRFGVGIGPEPASTRTIKFAFAAGIAAALGVALTLCAARLLLRSKQHQQH
jgi:hypothetical protein